MHKVINKFIKIVDIVNYWAIILLPFSIAIAPAPMSVFMGFIIFTYLVKLILNKPAIFSYKQFVLPLACLFSITCVSLVNSIDLSGSIRGGVLRLIMYIVVFFAVADGVKQKEHLKKIAISMIAGLLLVSFDGFWQVFSGVDFIHGYEAINNIGLVRATASFKDANLLGIYLSGFAPLCFGLSLYYFKGKWKISLNIISLLVLAAVALTYSRPTLLAVYLVLVFLVYVKKDKLKLIFLIGLLLISPFLLPKSIKEYARDVRYDPILFMCNADRVAVYRNTARMIKAHPFIGVGANASMKTYRYYKEKPEFMNVVTLDEMKAHNNFLQMAAEIGLIGLGIFLWFLYRLFKQGYRIYKATGNKYLKIVSLSLVACLIAFLVNGLTESSLFYSRVALVFWYLSGLLVALKNISYEN
ncbi:MAG: O-antigen ligase family protein [Candidatus Omnitrophota bacterium]